MAADARNIVRIEPVSLAVLVVGDEPVVADRLP
jgi:hypothetical protein